MQNPQQNINKLNLTMYEKNTTPQTSGSDPIIQGLFNISKFINVINHITKLKEKSNDHVNICKMHLTKFNIHL